VSCALAIPTSRNAANAPVTANIRKFLFIAQ
jgi:hypothetical protein